MLDVCLLGTGGMMPLPNRFLTSMIIRLNGRLLLIDCGEGTQVSAKMLGWGFKNVDIICFTHMHADHISGLPGFLLTIGNSGRTEPIKIIGPTGIKKVYDGLSTIFPEIPFDVDIIELNLDEKTTMSQNIAIKDFNIKALYMDHKIPCLSYCIEIDRAGKFIKENAINLDIPVNLWNRLQKGETIIYKDRKLEPSMVLGNDRTGIKLCYCTDTRPLDRLVNFIEKSDLFVCEGLYGEDEKKESATEKKHMIFSEAAHMARRGYVDELWLTHFSPALTEPEAFLHNATKIFEKTIIGKDRLIKTLYFKE